MTTVYVKLLDEGVDVWRPVEAEAVGQGTYRLIAPAHQDPTEHWEFPPGSVVACEIQDLSDGATLVATQRVSSD